MVDWVTGMKTISLATKIHAVPVIRPLLDDYCISETPGRACQWNVRERPICRSAFKPISVTLALRSTASRSGPPVLRGAG